MAESKKVWNDAEIKMLLSLYEENPLIWDVKSDGYRNRNVKQSTLQAIATTVNETTRKLHNLRSQFMQEVKKMKSKKSGIGTNEVFISTWPYFSAMKFIQRTIDTSETTENLIGQTSRSSCDLHGSTEPKSPPKKRLKKTKEELPEEIKKAVNLLNQPADDEQIYGDYVAYEMRQIKNPANKRKLRRMINDAIMHIGDRDASESESWQPFSLSDGSSTSSNFAINSPVQCIPNTVVTHDNSPSHGSTEASSSNFQKL